MGNCFHLHARYTFSFAVLPLLTALAQNPAESSGHEQSIETNKDTILAELRSALKSEFDLFYPLCIDTVDGGYFSDINYKWQLEGRQAKMIVTQARHVWSLSTGSIFYKEKEPYLEYARHGFVFLKNVMWDKDHGGFYDLVTREGKPISFGYGPAGKTAYGNGFAIYGLAAYYRAFGDTAALNLAVKTFEWLDKHSYDPEYGGYFQNLLVNGDPQKDWYKGIPPKDQNSMIHLMEAFTELYDVWPNETLRQRLDMLFHEIRDIVVGSKGYMTLFFNRDWTLVSYRDSTEENRKSHLELDHISFGHDVETAYLLLETSKALGLKNDTTTLRIAKQLDDFALANGWDKEKGGIYDGGYEFKGDNKVTIVLSTKEWWSQIEALNSFLMMSELFPDDENNYYLKFCVQWDYVQRYLIDHKYGGWFWGGIDEAPNLELGSKSSIWKCNYHTTRGLENCMKRLARSSEN
ncbi:MAG TPA: AGE family epimerase/isomerase [Candidatus Acidoferrales bacterium]|nr:AGE family epimerase/isomerase [Candidatus Acidoferrales bacterium]